MDTDSARHHTDAAAVNPHRGRALTVGLRVTGAGLLSAAAAIHLDLYVTGYRSIPVIGGLFLLQVIVAFIIGGAVLLTGSRLAAAAGAVFALATLGGYLLSVRIGLFGFKEIRTAAGIAAGVIEVAAFAALAIMATRPRYSSRAWAIGGVSAVALVLLGVAVAGAGPAAGPTAGGTLKTTTVDGRTVLADSKGRTLYWFAPDTPARSACTGVCAQYWPPVTGGLTAGPGIAGRLGTITRPDGSAQATYNGHPLYTYIGDTGPGQANGNNLNLNGGLWHDLTVRG